MCRSTSGQANGWQKKSTQIVVQFKDIPINLLLCGNGNTMLLPNLLVIHIQPDEGITLPFKRKRKCLGGGTFAQPIKLDLTAYNCGDGINHA